MLNPFPTHNQLSNSVLVPKNIIYMYSNFFFPKLNKTGGDSLFFFSFQNPSSSRCPRHDPDSNKDHLYIFWYTPYCPDEFDLVYTTRMYLYSILYCSLNFLCMWALPTEKSGILTPCVLVACLSSSFFFSKKLKTQIMDVDLESLIVVHLLGAIRRLTKIPRS